MCLNKTQRIFSHNALKANTLSYKFLKLKYFQTVTSTDSHIHIKLWKMPVTEYTIRHGKLWDNIGLTG